MKKKKKRIREKEQTNSILSFLHPIFSYLPVSYYQNLLFSFYPFCQLHNSHRLYQHDDWFFLLHITNFLLLLNLVNCSSFFPFRAVDYFPLTVTLVTSLELARTVF
jgi:hypothetical protein